VPRFSRLRQRAFAVRLGLGAAGLGLVALVARALGRSLVRKIDHPLNLNSHPDHPATVYGEPPSANGRASMSTASLPLSDR
jgi:hypothetical protein